MRVLWLVKRAFPSVVTIISLHYSARNAHREGERSANPEMKCREKPFVVVFPSPLLSHCGEVKKVLIGRQQEALHAHHSHEDEHRRLDDVSEQLREQ